MSGAMNTKRRDFLKSAGGIAVAFSWSVPTVLAQQAARPDLPGSLGTNRMLDGWIRVNPAGTVTVFTGKCELGQGILTALAQIAAEELDVAYERVEIVSADTARTPNEGMTAGSLSVENSGTALRFACAEARQILLELAAAKLGVAVANLSVSDGTVTGSGKRHLLGARTRSEPGARGLGPGEAETTRAAQDSRPQHPAPRHPGQGDGRCRLCAGLAASRHGAWPRGAAATLWRQARQLRRGQGQGDAGSHRGGA